MAKAKRKKAGTSKSASPGGEPKILLLGNGPSLPWWLERLEEARAEYVHVESQGEAEMPWKDPDLIIETEDLRFDDHEEHVHEHELHEWEEEDESLPTLGGGPGQVPLTEIDETEVMVPENGVILVPCYISSPTSLAAIYGEHGEQVAGYTLFPRPESESGLGIIEIARPLQTSDAAWDAAVAGLRSLGFSPEVVGDAPAGIFGRSVAMLVNEAALALNDGIASVEDMDNAMRLGVNYPKGLFEWADELGPDLILDMLEGLYDHYLDDRYRPAPLLKHVVAAGRKFGEL